MRRLACWMLLAAMPLGVSWGATANVKAAPPKAVPTPPLSVFQISMKDLARNVCLGEELTQREGSADELALVQKLADRGLESARTLIGKDPKSAEAYYLLGSWLLYGYRVVEIDRFSVDPNGDDYGERASAVAFGLNDSPQAGLDALRTAQELAPMNLQYLMDYALALVDSEKPAEAMAVVKKVWVQKMILTPAQEVHVALLMSDIHIARGELAEARTWIYRALSSQAQNAPILVHLRKLDELATEAAYAAAKRSPAQKEQGQPEPLARAAFEDNKATPTASGPDMTTRQSPFELAVGQSVARRPGFGTQPVITRKLDISGSDGWAGSIAIGEWSLRGTGGQSLKMIIEQKGRLTLGLTPEPNQEPWSLNIYWADQPFELLCNGQVVDTFQNTAEYVQALRE